MLIFPLLLSGQYEEVEEQHEKEYTPKTFIGAGNGINNFNGIIGAFAETRIVQGLSTFGGIGLGSWGYKASAGFRYYHHFPKKIYYSVFASVATGIKEYEVTLETESPGGNADVTLNLLPAYNLNIAVGYQFLFARRLRFNFELGYSIPINTDTYEVETPGIVLSETSESVMKLLSPGGIIFGIGFSTGF